MDINNNRLTLGSQNTMRELTNEFGPLTFGDALLSYRKGEELNQKEFATLLGISSQSLCDIEKGRKIPSPLRAASIAKKLEEPIAFWVQLALQDTIKKENLDLKVSVEPELQSV